MQREQRGCRARATTTTIIIIIITTSSSSTQGPTNQEDATLHIFSSSIHNVTHPCL
jgi:hypothetical protein